MRVIFLFLVFARALFSQEVSSPADLANLQGDPSAVASGYINVITGDFVYKKSDLMIQGEEPISLERYYTSRENSDSDSKWEIFQHHTAELKLPKKKRKENSKRSAKVDEANGIRIPYSEQKELKILRPEPNFFAKGSVNNQGYNFKKNRVEYDDESLTVYYSNGTYRTFRRRHNVGGDYYYKYRLLYIHREKLPNGRLKHYEWSIKDGEPQLQKITTTDPTKSHIFAEAKFSYQGREVKIKSSDKKCLKYIFSKKSDHEKAFLRRIRSSDYPEEWLKRKSHKLLKRILPDGREVTLAYSRKGRVKILEFPHGIRYGFRYNTKEGVTSVTNPDHSITQYFYNPETFRLTEIRYLERMGRRLKTEKFTWSKEGNLLQKEILNGENKRLLCVKYEYDEDYNCKYQTTIGQITSTDSLEDEYSIHYTYDDLHRLRKECYDDGKTIEYNYLKDTHLPTSKITSRNGSIYRRIRYTYNEDHTLIEESTDAGEGSEIEILKRITPRGCAPFYGLPEWVETFDRSGLIRKIHLAYDERGNVEETTIYDANYEKRFSILTKYNKKGQLILKQDPKGDITQYDYDENGNLSYETTPSGVHIDRVYDKMNRLRKQIEKAGGEEQITEHQYGTKSKPVATIDNLGGVYRYSYDPLGNQKSTSLPQQGTQKSTYNALGYVISTTDPRHYATKITPNILGDPLKIEHPDGTREHFTYNSNGTLATYIDQNQTQTQYIYDDFGNICRETISDSFGMIIGEIERKYNAFHLEEETNLEGHVTTYTYTSANQLKSKTYGGCTTTYSYDPLGRLATEIMGDYSICRTYDDLDRVIKEEEFSENNRLRLVETKHDVHSNPKEIIRYPNNEPESSYIEYDPYGRPRRKTDPMGGETTFSYAMEKGYLFTTIVYPENIVTVEVHDSLKKLVLYQKFDPHGMLIEEKKCTYDVSGNLSMQKSGFHTLEYTYDSMNRMESLTESNARTQTFTYTKTGELDTVTKPDGITLSYTYDPLSHLKTLRSSKGDISYTFTHNKLGQLISSKDRIQDTSTTRVVDPHGNILEEKLANDYCLTYTYDSCGRRETTTLPSGKTISYTYKGPYIETINVDDHTHSFEYDLALNPILEKTINEKQIHRSYDALSRPNRIDSPYLQQSCTYTSRGNIDTITTDAKTKSYRYDSHDHLIEEPDNTYSYDSLHNRTAKNAISYAINHLNEIETLSYDLNGNLLSDGTNTYEYDSLDRLIRVNGTPYTYDAQHRRIAEGSTSYIWDHDNEIGTPTCYRILNPTQSSECSATILIILRGNPILPVDDLQGNLIKVYNFDSRLMELHPLTAFGELTSPLCQIPWAFASKRHDDSGLIYFGRRFYDPNLGRFITPDPAGYTDSQNLYAYALNNPLILFDPHGLNLSYFSDNWLPDTTGPPPNGPPRFIDYDERYKYMINPPSPTPTLKFPSTTYYEPSHTFGLNRPEMPDRGIVFINGMNASKTEATSHAEYISDMMGGYNVHTVYNATHGFSNDLAQAINSVHHRWSNPERELLKTITNFFTNSSPTATLLLVAHSHGAAIARNVLHYYPIEEHKERTYLISMAPAAYTNPRDCGTVKHFRHPNDIVPTFDKYGAKQFSHTIFDVCAPVKNSFNTHHGFQDPVYKKVLKGEITKYLEEGYIK